MGLNETTVTAPPATMRQYLAAAAQALANKLAGRVAAAPTQADLRGVQLREAQVALIHAEAEEERWRFTVGMLRARAARLSNEQ